jgi:riboflavin kinase / FMN adenylyltransferase
VNILHTFADLPESLRGGAVAIGNFDGVHLGHARLIERLHAMAERVGGPSIVFTFDPPPARVLRPDAAPEPLIWTERKIELLGELGVDVAIVYPTDRALLELDPRQFFDRIVREQLQAAAMVEGPNFFFGHNRAGNVEVLREFCRQAQMPFEVPEPVDVAGQIVSSSRIRGLVLAGRMEEAAALLGRPYRIRGTVVRGAGRGAELGYPTANVDHIDTLLPAEGIYAARARTDDAWYPAAVSLGPNPTFSEGRLKVEVHLIGYDGIMYGRPLEVDFLARLREIRQFVSVASLVEQIAGDVARTVEIASRSDSTTAAPTQL